jgi:hypothetical protein
MRTFRFIASSGALVLASFILFISLSAGNSRMLAQQGTFESSQKQFYLSQNILPDHVAYPVLMALDKAKLMTASEDKQFYLEIEYAHRRLAYSQQLLDRQNPMLALTTLTKAQKYLIQAGHSALETDASSETKKQMLQEIATFNQQVIGLKTAFTDVDSAVVDQHNKEIFIIQEQLAIQVGNNT